MNKRKMACLREIKLEYAVDDFGIELLRLEEVHQLVPESRKLLSFSHRSVRPPWQVDDEDRVLQHTWLPGVLHFPQYSGSILAVDTTTLNFSSPASNMYLLCAFPTTGFIGGK